MPGQFGRKIRELREQRKWLQREVAAKLEMDGPFYSRMERGERKAKREQVMVLAELFGVSETELVTLWLADQVSYLVADEEFGLQALIVAEADIRYGRDAEDDDEIWKPVKQPEKAQKK